MKAIKIIHVVLGKANPQRMNGVNKVVYELATKQTEAGEEISVWGITKDTVHNYPERKFQTKLFKAYKNKFRLDKEFTDALKSVDNATVFHLHGGFNPIFYTISKKLKQHNLPFVFTPHGAYNVIAMKKNQLQKKIFLQLFEKPMLRKATIIHSLGKSEITGLKSFYNNNKSMLIPYGFENDSENNNKPVTGKFIIGFCGRIDIYTKGLDLLIDAFVLVKQLVKESELWIIGDGSEMKAFVQLIKDKKLAESVKLLGSKFGEDKIDLLKQLHVFTHPSRNEGLPTSVLEAASLGIPCVISDATNLGDSIAAYNAGEVIEAVDANILFSAIMKIYNVMLTGEWPTISTNAKQMIRREYNWNKIITRFDELYNKAC